MPYLGGMRTSSSNVWSHLDDNKHSIRDPQRGEHRCPGPVYAILELLQEKDQEDQHAEMCGDHSNGRPSEIPCARPRSLLLPSHLPLPPKLQLLPPLLGDTAELKRESRRRCTRCWHGCCLERCRLSSGRVDFSACSRGGVFPALSEERTAPALLLRFPCADKCTRPRGSRILPPHHRGPDVAASDSLSCGVGRAGCVLLGYTRHALGGCVLLLFLCSFRENQRYCCCCCWR